MVKEVLLYWWQFNSETCIACNVKFSPRKSLLLHVGKVHDGFDKILSGKPSGQSKNTLTVFNEDFVKQLKKQL